MCWDSDELLTCAIDDVEDGSVTMGWWKLFNKVERNGMPWLGWNGKLLNKSEWLVSGVLVSFAGDAAVNEIFNISTDIQPGVVSLDQDEHLVLARVSCSQVIVLELEDMRLKVAGIGSEIGNVNVVVN